MPLDQQQRETVNRINESGEMSAMDRGRLYTWRHYFGNLTSTDRATLDAALAIDRPREEETPPAPPRSMEDARKALRANPIALANLNRAREAAGLDPVMPERAS